MRFVKQENIIPKRKTEIWCICIQDNATTIFIGDIKWNQHWRRYCLYPNDMTYWDKECLNEIAEFCDKETEKRKRMWKNKHKLKVEGNEYRRI